MDYSLEIKRLWQELSDMSKEFGLVLDRLSALEAASAEYQQQASSYSGRLERPAAEGPATLPQ